MNLKIYIHIENILNQQIELITKNYNDFQHLSDQHRFLKQPYLKGVNF